MAEILLAETHGPVRLLTLNRPERLNALDAALRSAVADALGDAAEDPGIRVVVLTGTGDRAFCAGQDLNESAPLGSADEGDWIETWRRLFAAFLDHPKPLVAAVNGIAAGGGLEMAMFADIRVAVPAARFIMAEIDVGLPTLIGGHMLEAHVYHSRMAEIVLSGRPISGEEARDIGLVHHLAEAGCVVDRALDVAHELAAKPPRAMMLNIRRFRALRMQALQRDDVFAALVDYQRESMASGEPQRVMAAFLAERERRKSTRTP